MSEPTAFQRETARGLNHDPSPHFSGAPCLCERCATCIEAMQAQADEDTAVRRSYMTEATRERVRADTAERQCNALRAQVEGMYTPEAFDQVVRQRDAAVAELRRVIDDEDYPCDWWDKGYEARKEGKPRDANPYSADSYGVPTSHDLWDWGWLTYDAMAQRDAAVALLHDAQPYLQECGWYGWVERADAILKGQAMLTEGAPFGPTTDTGGIIIESDE